MSLFRTLAGAFVDGTNVAFLARKGFSAVARTANIANGSWDLTLAEEIPTGKAITRVAASAAALASDYVWLDTHTLRVSLRTNGAVLTDADFSVTVKRCKA